MHFNDKRINFRDLFIFNVILFINIKFVALIKSNHYYNWADMQDSEILKYFIGEFSWWQCKKHEKLSYNSYWKET